MRWVVALAVLSGCLKPSFVDCGDGSLCPTGYTCTPGGCRSPEQLSACDGLGDGDACRVDGDTGICDQGACIVPNCGNGVVEPGEVCDDGNTLNRDGCNGTCTSKETCGNGIVELSEQCDCGDAEHPGDPSCNNTFNGGPNCNVTCKVPTCGDSAIDAGEVCDDGNRLPGDGCSFDCRSNETCGNGMVDYFAGETCDDGNTANRDLCSANCRDEPLGWHSSLGGATIGPRAGIAAAYDAARARIVAFGGMKDTGLWVNETWEHDGAKWTKRAPSVKPIARWGHAMAYDSRRHRIVLFGGATSFGQNAETWEYDGVDWIQRMPATAPPARSTHAMAFDSARGKIVLFGGYTANGGVNDTWEYDGTTWAQVSTATSPAMRMGHGMAYDPVRARTVMFGGDDGGGQFSDTWEYDGSNWQLIDNSDYPGARGYVALTFDARRGHVVLFGGTVTDPASPDVPTYYGDAAEWDGSSWQQITSAVGPADRAHHAFVHDLARGWDVLITGYHDPDADGAADFISDVPALAADWIDLLAPPPAPGTGSGRSIAYDSRRGVLVLQRGTETWEFDDRLWTKKSPLASPPVAALAVTYDPARGVVVMVATNATTWEYDGTTWSQRTTTTAPPTQGVMTYDAVRKLVVLFSVADTWEYDATNWTKRSLAASPSPRNNPSIAYDQARQRVVLFGGTGNSSPYTRYDETWEYDGVTWQLRTLGASPPARNSAAFAYDAGLRRCVLVGGFGGSGQLGDTWLYDGTTWTELVDDTISLPIPPIGIAFDAMAQHALLYTGDGTGEVWQLSSVDQVAGEACSAGIDYDNDGKAGCADSDCWGSCSPLCAPTAPTTSCIAQPGCGDGLCEGVENCRNCTADCAPGGSACPAICGDFVCDPGESMATCPGDCP